MNLENYHQEAKIIDLMKANLVALKYLIFFGIIFSVPFFLIWKNDFSLALFNSESHFIKFLFPLIAMILGIIVHELIHGMFFALFATKGIKAIKFGILWKISVAINRNLLADLASRLPIAFATPREIALETELKAVQEELNALKLENKIYKDLLK